MLSHKERWQILYSSTLWQHDIFGDNIDKIKFPIFPYNWFLLNCWTRKMKCCKDLNLKILFSCKIYHSLDIKGIWFLNKHAVATIFDEIQNWELHGRYVRYYYKLWFTFFDSNNTRGPHLVPMNHINIITINQPLQIISVGWVTWRVF